MAGDQAWSVNKIRKEFIDFFEGKKHRIVPSAPMVLKDDPTLMFTNAGMNQFKDLFLGINKAKSPRVADTQKCLRVSGKHNDLEEVGVDTYHHTMFEMLGNWSFGDYFKEEAISWAWELLTEVYKIDPERLYVTVFEGDKGDELSADTDAENIWKKYIDPSRILRCDKKDNFWEMGDTGPCGPCSEIHVDIRSEKERKELDGRELVNKDHPLVIEIWNLVFMQFNRMATGKLENLPERHVDTGMGLERLAMVLQGEQSNYDTDVFSGMISELETISGMQYKRTDEKRDVAFRVIADHVRAVSFSIADGQLPSNTGAGYVIRRILRRAIRYGYSFLNLDQAFVYKLVATLVNQMADSFPEIKSQQQLIEKVIKEEEEGFLRTLSKGLERLKRLTDNNSKVSGKDAFELYDTFGFPIDLTQLIAEEKGIEVDLVEFEGELEKQKNRSRSQNTLAFDDWVVLSNSNESVFDGYDKLEDKVQVLKYRAVKEKNKDFVQLVLDRTPFYPEGGGQVGDTGLLVQGELKIPVLDTQKENDLIVHKVPAKFNDFGGEFIAQVKQKERALAASNHTATHLLHHALRDILGEHVEQKGSLVNSKYLRFDFSHFEKVDSETLATIERSVNKMISDSLPLEEFRSIPIEEAKSKGAMSLFGEKYGDFVRMIQFGDSKELCGGTHVANTSDIQRFKIVKEESVAAGIRRIEAITNEAVFDLYETKMDELQSLQEILRFPKDSKKALQSVLDENKALAAKLLEEEQKAAMRIKSELISSAEDKGGVQFIGKVVELNPKLIKDLAFQLKNEMSDLVMVLGTRVGEKVNLSIMISDSVVEQKGLNANALIKECSPLIKGGGGGQAFFATAGGKDADGLQAAIDLVAGKL